MKKNFKKTFSKVMTLTLIASLALGATPNIAKAEEVEKLLNMPLTVEAKEKLLNDYSSFLPELDTILKDNENQGEVIRVIVEVNGKSAQEMSSDGKTITEEARIAITDAQKAVVNEAVKIEGVEVRHNYTNVFNGFSAEVKRGDIEKLENIPGVRKVTKVQRYTENMKNAKKLTQIDEVWKNHSLKGEGMVVAIVDSGVDYRHSDFSNPEEASKMKLNRDNVEMIKQSGVLKADKNAQTYFTDKIPFGYNYADKNNEIIDLRDQRTPHGAHVAGIVGANGKDELVERNKAVKGVAPNVQLLAMKVFSNGENGMYTYEDDQLAAIDDAVALGADVINMSLGSPSGFRADNNPVQDAIRRATNAGVMVVVAAGNSAYSTDPYGLGSINDQITASDPALAKDALMVASYENTKVSNKAVNFKNSNGNVIAESQFTKHQVDFESINKKEYEMIYGGFGNASELKNVKDKIVLIKRGDIGFTEKILNAQEKGAVGIIIYNSEDDSLINMPTDENIKIPAIFVGKTVGEKLANKIKSGKVYFNDDVKLAETESATAAECSEFTSWGPSPSLEFEPQVAAPGGNIFSTLGKGNYGTMSGTSMATPHVSGSMALLLQSIKSYAPELQGRDLISYAKNIMMNTSKVEINKNTNIPYSPRRQGAGLIQVEDAVRNRVAVTNNGQASIELKEIKENEKIFTLNVHNYGEKEVEYEIESLGGVLTQDPTDKYGRMIEDISLSENDAKISFDKNIIKIPAKQEKTIEVTLKIGEGLSKDRYLEGFINLNSKTENTPSLVIPYIGFYGDWDSESITTNNAWDNNKHKFVKATKRSGEYKNILVENLALSITRRYGKESINILGINGRNPDRTNKYDSSKIAISPNGDSVNDVIFPGIYLMRNAKNVKVEILDSNEKIIRTLETEESFSKNMIAIDQGKQPTVMEKLAWDGTVFDNSTGKYVVVPNGQYTYRVKMKIDFNNVKEESIDIPIKVDNSSPSFKVEKYEKLEDGKIKVYFKAEDNESGIKMDAKFPVMINGKLDEEATKSDTIYDENTGLYSKIINELTEKENEIVIGGFDYADNLGGTSIKINFK